MPEGRECPGSGAPRKAQGRKLKSGIRACPWACRGGTRRGRHRWGVPGSFNSAAGAPSRGGRLGIRLGAQGLQFQAHDTQFIIRGGDFPITLGEGGLGIVEDPPDLVQIVLQGCDTWIGVCPRRCLGRGGGCGLAGRGCRRAGCRGDETLRDQDAQRDDRYDPWQTAGAGGGGFGHAAHRRSTTWTGKAGRS